MNFSKLLRAAKTAAPFVVGVLLALVVAWMVLRSRKERYDSGCNDEYPTKGGRSDGSNKDKCCITKYSRKCQDTSTCPADYPFIGSRSDGSNTGKCCKNRNSNKCQGGSSSPSSSPAPGPAPTCQWFQTYDAARGQCTGCPPAQKWDGSNCVYDGETSVETRSDTNFGGSRRTYKVGEYSVLYINDSMSSIKVPKGLKVTLFSDTNFGGSQLTLDANDHYDLGSFTFPAGTWAGRNVCGGANTGCWNDSASSMKVYLA